MMSKQQCCCSIPSKFESVLVPCSRPKKGFGCRSTRFSLRRQNFREPGPGSYDLGNRRKNGTSFGRSSGRREQFQRPETPGPGDYRPRLLKSRGSSFRKEKSVSSLLSDCDFVSPGPGSYDLVFKSRPTSRSGSSRSLRFESNRCLGGPAPGAYDPASAYRGKLARKVPGAKAAFKSRSQRHQTSGGRVRPRKQNLFPALTLARELGDALEPSLRVLQQNKYPALFQSTNQWQTTPGPASYDLSQRTPSISGGSLCSSRAGGSWSSSPRRPTKHRFRHTIPASPGPGTYLAINSTKRPESSSVSGSSYSDSKKRTRAARGGEKRAAFTPGTNNKCQQQYTAAGDNILLQVGTSSTFAPARRRKSRKILLRRPCDNNRFVVTGRRTTSFGRRY